MKNVLAQDEAWGVSMLPDRKRIVRSVEVLTETHLPDVLHGREPHVRHLLERLSPRHGRGAGLANLWLYGKPGTGKTSGARVALSQLRQSENLPAAYVNCCKHSTLHSVVDAINREFRLLETERSDARVRLERLRQALGGRPCVIVLDEIDLAPPKERNRIIYNLLDVPRIGLVCICNSRYPLVALDPRTKSRFRPEFLEFPAYSEAELAAILESRAEQALFEGAWERKLLAKIARLADGDARVAIQTLRSAAETAERLGHAQIRPQHVQEGWGEAKHLKHRYVIEQLPAHHQLIYEIVRSSGEVSSTKLREEYERRCAAAGRQPVAVRTFQLYVQKLVRLRLLRGDRAPVRGSVFLYSLEE